MITQCVCTSFKVECFKAIHDFTATTGDTFKIALYDSTASLGPDTTAYTTTGEVSGTGYSAGGITLTSVTPTSSGYTAICDFADATFSTVTLTARGALIYNSTKSNRAVAVLDFGIDRTKTAENFVVTFPSADSDNAIIRTK